MSKLKLFANCIPVKGANRSVICDLQRSEIFIIPNDLYNILELYSGKSISEIKREYGNEYDEIIDEYFVFLLKNELVFKTDNPNLFPELNLDWYYPFEISNAIIDFDNKSEFDLKFVLNQLDRLKCKFLQFRFFDIINHASIKDLLTYLDDTSSIILSIDIIMPFHNKTSEEMLLSLLREHPRINLFFIYNATHENLTEPIRGNRAFIVYTKQLLNPKSCGIVSSKYFSINIKSFTEGLRYNSCLNRKISIDVKGFIKNCPSMITDYGNINEKTLTEALNHPDFKKLWSITKDQVKICRDCEFRYVCTDCRAYLENPEDQYSKPLKCGYDPYTNTWEEWSENPLKRKAMEYYSM